MKVVEEGHLICHMIDVDMQGSGILFQTNQHNILIDLAFSTGTDKLVAYLLARGVETLDLVILTHPHRDHIAAEGQGGLTKFLANFTILEIWSNGVPLPVWYDGITVSPSGPDGVGGYDAILNTIFPDGYTVGGVGDYPTIVGISEPTIKYVEPRMGDVFTYGDLTIKILYPRITHDFSNTNASSLVTQFIFQGKKIMMCADALVGTEGVILNNFTTEELKSDLLYIGHHGIDDATSLAWVNAVNPSIATYQRRDRDKDATRIEDMFRDKNIPIIDIYMGEPWVSPDRSKFVDYVFDVSVDGIEVLTLKDYLGVEETPANFMHSSVYVKQEGQFYECDLYQKSNGEWQFYEGVWR